MLTFKWVGERWPHCRMAICMVRLGLLHPTGANDVLSFTLL